VLISVFGALNGSILAGPRVYYAMAKDNLFFKKVAEVHPRFRTPSFAITIQALWASVLALSGTFEQLITFVIFTSIIFWIASTTTVFTLRKKQPDLPRPYKTWGYPVVPIIFILTSMGILVNTLIEKPVESLAGLGLTLIGIPIYFYWKKRDNLTREQNRSEEPV
jgi:APA family basic amino acid/polyamine antiporter